MSSFCPRVVNFGQLVRPNFDGQTQAHGLTCGILLHIAAQTAVALPSEVLCDSVRPLAEGDCIISLTQEIDGHIWVADLAR